MSDKLAKFERLAERRVSEAIKKIRLVGNLANKNNYSYTGQHAKQIIEVLEAEFKLLKIKFKDDEHQDGVFTFKS
jgi:hypothetical protein